jgi:Family of unknown function (DUF6221)
MEAMNDLSAFIEARLDEDEAAARNVSRWPGREIQEELDDPEHYAWRAKELSPPIAQHIIRHGPARALREVAAGRAIIERYKHSPVAPPPNANFTAGPDDGYRQACADAIRDLAAIWSDHPDYRQES